MPKPRMMFYDDGRHVLIYMYEPPMQKEEYLEAVDGLLGTPIEALVFCLGEGRTMLHDTKVGRALGPQRREVAESRVAAASPDRQTADRRGQRPLDDHL